MAEQIVIAVLAALALASCYASPALLLDPDAAAHPIEDGVYQRDGQDARYRVSLGSDGWYRIEEVQGGGLIGDTHHVLLNAITLEGGREAFAAAEETDQGYEYGLVLLDHGRGFLATPDCDDPVDRNDAVDHGGQAEDDNPMTRICSFKSRGALVAALAAYAGHASFGAPFLRK